MNYHKGYYNINIPKNKTFVTAEKDTAKLMLSLDKTHEEFKKNLLAD